MLWDVCEEAFTQDSLSGINRVCPYLNFFGIILFMVRMARNILGGQIYHVINRATSRRKIFSSPKDYQEFLLFLALAKKQFSVDVYAFAVMPNHIHLLLSPKGDNDMSRFMHWLFTTHANTHRTKTETVGEGHVYQGRYKSFVIQDDEHYYTVLKYVEQNPLRAGLVKRAEDWQWGSAWTRINTPKEKQATLLTPSFLDLPEPHQKWINDALDDATVDDMRKSVNRSLPYGSPEWKNDMFALLGIDPPRPRGRPNK
jgi:putative transposase